MNEALAKLGAPANIIQTIEEPSIEASSELMKGVDVVVATGGAGMVKSAYSSGKPAYGVGPGNVQCIIDTDADIAVCVPKIIAGRKFDNGIICSGEQTVIAHKDQYDAIMAEFKKNGAVLITDAAEKAALREALFPGGVMNKDLVGQSVQKIAAAAGLNVPEGTPVILVEADGYGKDDLFSKEKMCPVISTYKYDNFEEAVVIARANLDVEGKGHSVSIHSNNREHLEYAGETIEVARVLVNQICSTMNGGAFTNSLTPTTTLGCCSWGNNSISENFGFKHLINYIRIAENLPNKAVPTDEEVWG
jgi:succinate-semialdehyde dehydrogenase